MFLTSGFGGKNFTFLWKSIGQNAVL
jgi:5-keto 4-deoxyuronate isomerase